MKVIFHVNFKKRYKKLRNLQGRIDDRVALFMRDPYHPTLNNHALQGAYRGLRSINITRDFRAIYALITSEIALFIALDTHGNLYQ